MWPSAHCWAGVWPSWRLPSSICVSLIHLHTLSSLAGERDGELGSVFYLFKCFFREQIKLLLSFLNTLLFWSCDFGGKVGLVDLDNSTKVVCMVRNLLSTHWVCNPTVGLRIMFLESLCFSEWGLFVLGFPCFSCPWAEHTLPDSKTHLYQGSCDVMATAIPLILLGFSNFLSSSISPRHCCQAVFQTSVMVIPTHIQGWILRQHHLSQSTYYDPGNKHFLMSWLAWFTGKILVHFACSQTCPCGKVHSHANLWLKIITRGIGKCFLNNK